MNFVIKLFLCLVLFCFLNVVMWWATVISIKHYSFWIRISKMFEENKSPYQLKQNTNDCLHQNLQLMWNGGIRSCILVEYIASAHVQYSIVDKNQTKFLSEQCKLQKAVPFLMKMQKSAEQISKDRLVFDSKTLQEYSF